MGCMSSKIITKSASFRDEWTQLSFRRKGDETIVSKEGGSKFIALMCTANTVAGSLEEGSHETADANTGPYNSLEHTSSYSTNTKDVDIETVNTKGHDERSSTVEAVTSERSIIVTNLLGPCRRFRTIEDFDAMMEAKQSQAEDIKCELDKVVEVENKSTIGSHEKGSKRKAMAKDLAALKVPSFEFSRAGSLKDWLVLEVPSPGSYVTPKFGSFVAHTQDEDKVAVFNTELVWQFEQAMEHFAMEEDCILEKIVEGRESKLLI